MVFIKLFPFNFQYLNNPAFKCRSSEHLCVADLEQKGVDVQSGQNLRGVVPNREIPLRFSVIISEQEPSSFLCKFSQFPNFGTNSIQLTNYLFEFFFAAVGTKSLLGQINNIVYMDTPVPGLTQDDSFVRYCNESTVANKNTTEGLHYCTHRIEMELYETVDLLLFDEGSKFL